MNTEKEVQARLEFKINELLSALENTAKANWGIAFQSNSQKHSHYWEAFNQMKAMLQKEMQMAVPYNDMADRRRKERRDEAINKIMDRFCNRGEPDFHHKQRLLVSIIEDAQNW